MELPPSSSGQSSRAADSDGAWSKEEEASTCLRQASDVLDTEHTLEIEQADAYMLERRSVVQQNVDSVCSSRSACLCTGALMTFCFVSGLILGKAWAGSTTSPVLVYLLPPGLPPMPPPPPMVPDMPSWCPRTLVSKAEITACAPNGDLPDFIILGAQKAGTTSFFHLLAEHPRFLAPSCNSSRGAWCTADFGSSGPKELHYFDDSQQRYELPLVDYERNFYSTKHAPGFFNFESTPNYLMKPRYLQRIHNDLPQTKLITMLREPIARLYSAWNHFKRTTLTNFTKAVIRPDCVQIREFHDGKTYCQILDGIYVWPVTMLYSMYDENQLLFLSAERFFEDEKATMDTVIRFLHVPVFNSKSSMIVHNRGSFKNPEYHGVEDIAGPTRRQLEAYYSPYNDELWGVFDEHQQPREEFEGYKWKYPLAP